MKVCIVCTLYPPYINGGAEISTRYLAMGIKKMGHDIHIITSGKEDKIEYIDNIKVYRLKNQNIYWRYPQRDKPLWKKAIWHIIDSYIPLYNKKIFNILQIEKPDIIHTGNLCGLSCYIWDIAKSLNIPTVHTLRDYALICPQQTMLKGNNSCNKQCLGCKFYSIKKKKLSSKVNAVVGISNFILKKHIDCGYFNNTCVLDTIPNSVPQLKIKQTRGNSIIGFIGRLSPEKGIELLIDAFLASANNMHKLIIAGKGNISYVNKIKEYSNDKRISFIGEQRVEEFLNSIDLLVVPSLWNEPFGRVVIEAYSAHCPVLVARNGGLAELVENNMSYSFSTKDKEELKNLLNSFFNKNLNFKKDNYPNTILKYSEEEMVNRYIEIYKQLISH